MSSLSERGEHIATAIGGGERWLAFGGLNCWKRAGRFDVSARRGSRRCPNAALTATFSRLLLFREIAFPRGRYALAMILVHLSCNGSLARKRENAENAAARLWPSYLSAFPFTISFPDDGRADFAGAEQSRSPERRSRGKHGYPGLSLPETAGYPWAARCFARKRAFMRAVSVTLNTTEYLFASAPPLRRIRNSDYGDPALYCRAYRHRRVSRQSCGFLEEIGSENPDTGRVDSGNERNRRRERERERERGGEEGNGRIYERSF
jgi:hypothetical protein